MSQVIESRNILEGVETLADLIDRLGGIPADRIRWRPLPGTATEKDVVSMDDHEDRLCELIDGVLVEKAMGFYESVVATVLIQMLRNCVDENDLGVVAGADGMMRLTAGRVYIPDISFLAWDQFPDRKLPREPIPDLHPDLAVEVLSQGNTPREMQRKRGDYFRSGTRLVWLIDPQTRSAEVFTAPDESTVLNERQSLDGGDVLPGFSLSLGDLFARAGERS